MSANKSAWMVSLIGILKLGILCKYQPPHEHEVDGGDSLGFSLFHLNSLAQKRTVKVGILIYHI
jgi:hypothetical protein